MNAHSEGAGEQHEDFLAVIDENNPSSASNSPPAIPGKVEDQNQYGGIDISRHNKGWEKLMHDLESIFVSLDLPDNAIAWRIQIVGILGPVATETLRTWPMKEQWVDIVQLACKLDEHRESEFLDLKCAIALLATQLAMCSRKNEVEKGTKGLKRLRQVPEQLLAARRRLEEDTQKEVLDAMIDLEQLKV
ncbi:MAG: hypothetical protein Q9201_007195 [Fulgogasparrea decipioides]